MKHSAPFKQISGGKKRSWREGVSVLDFCCIWSTYLNRQHITPLILAILLKHASMCRLAHTHLSYLWLYALFIIKSTLHCMHGSSFFTQFHRRSFHHRLPTSFITRRDGHENGHGLQRGAAWRWTYWTVHPLLCCLPLAASWQRKTPRVLVLDRRRNGGLQAGHEK